MSVNIDNSHLSGIPFSSTVSPSGPHTMSAPGNNVASAAAIYPCSMKGGKINRRRINKISNKYKMKGSKRTIKRRVRKMKGRMRTKYARSHKRTRHGTRHSRSYSVRHSRHQRGGVFSPPAVTPNYPASYNQYGSNNGSISNVYSLGGIVSPGDSALANPPIQSVVANANIPDNLNHNTLNAYGNIGAGSGFLSRGSF
jgi:hypothetical protein